MTTEMKMVDVNMGKTIRLSQGGVLTTMDQGRKFEDKVIDCYLDALRSMARGGAEGVRGKGASMGTLNEAQKAEQHKAYAHLRNARVFMFSPDKWGRIYRAADIFTSEVVANLPWEPAKPVQSSPAMTYVNQMIDNAAYQDAQMSVDFVDAVITAGAEVPIPERLPFDSIYIGMGDYLCLSENQVMARRLGSGSEWSGNMNSPTGLLHTGYLLAYSQDEFLAWEIHGIKGTKHYYALPVYRKSEWASPFDLNPWVVNSIVNCFLEHQTLVEEKAMGKLQRRKFGKKAKRKLPMPIPKPYYVITLRDELLTEIACNTNVSLQERTFEYEYRFDVRGHERCRFRRGPLPLEPKLEKKLSGYWPESSAIRSQTSGWRSRPAGSTSTKRGLTTLPTCPQRGASL